MTSKKKRLTLVRKVRPPTITWHYHPEREQMSVGMKYVYIAKTKTAPHCLIGFDLKYPERHVMFFDKSVAEDWAKQHKYKVVDQKKWARMRNKIMKKKGLTWK